MTKGLREEGKTTKRGGNRRGVWYNQKGRKEKIETLDTESRSDRKSLGVPQRFGTSFGDFVL